MTIWGTFFFRFLIFFFKQQLFHYIFFFQKCLFCAIKRCLTYKYIRQLVPAHNNFTSVAKAQSVESDELLDGFDSDLARVITPSSPSFLFFCINLLSS